MSKATMMPRNKINTIVNMIIIVLITLTAAVLVGSLIERDKTSAVSVSSGPYYYPNADGVQRPDSHDLTVGHVGKYKLVEGASRVTIEGLSNNGEQYGPIETNVTVERLDEAGKVSDTITGKALAFANLAKDVDAGYVFVDRSEAEQWVKVLNGNPSFVFDSSRSNVYSQDITDIKTGESYPAYNLASIAAASGGRGVVNGDGLTKINDDLYRKDDKYQATPRPEAEIATADGRTTYKANESFTLVVKGYDYSIYDRGIIGHNLALVNTQTGGEYQSIQNFNVTPSNSYSPQSKSFSTAQTRTLSKRSVGAEDTKLEVNEKPVAAVESKEESAEAGQATFTINKDHTPVLVEKNLLEESNKRGYTSSKMPDLSHLDKEKKWKVMIYNPTAPLEPVVGGIFATGTMVSAGWDGFLLIPDRDPSQVVFCLWDKFTFKEADNDPDGREPVIILDTKK